MCKEGKNCRYKSKEANEIRIINLLSVFILLILKINMHQVLPSKTE